MSSSTSSSRVNAVAALAGKLPGEMVKKRLEREGVTARGGPTACLRRLRARYELDLLGFLNGATVHELRALAAALELPPASSAAGLRQRLWLWGAGLERRSIVGAGVTELDVDGVQLVPVLAGSRLAVGRAAAAAQAVLPSARSARFPECASWPRPVPEEKAAPAGAPMPETLEDLLARADGLVGVRLGARGRDKGAYGQRIGDLLGLPRSSESAPDWQATVEVKTLAVVRALGAVWRIKDGPAISMRGVDAQAKAQRVLWIVRVDEGEVAGAPVLNWYYQELDEELTAAFERSRHLRPKGGAGTTGRGWYLRRDFFAACGLLRSLNG